MAEKSSKHESLLEARFAIQGDLIKAGSFAKDTDNPHLNSRFVSLTKYWQRLLPILHEHEVMVDFETAFTAEDTQVGLRVTHVPSGESESVWHRVAYEDKPRVSRVQSHGADQSYCMRYLIKSYFFLVDSEDDENEVTLSESAKGDQSGSNGKNDSNGKNGSNGSNGNGKKTSKSSDDRVAKQRLELRATIKDLLDNDSLPDEVKKKLEANAKDAWGQKDLKSLQQVKRDIEKTFAAIAVFGGEDGDDSQGE